jgi:hypothetical protein
MAIARVTGMPDYTASGTSKFIPELWSGQLQVKWYLTTVYASISNKDYDGEVKNQGDKVYIRTVPTLTIRDYEKGGKLQYERPESTALELTIDYAKYFAFVCDDIDKHQSDLRLMNTWSDDAAEQMKITIDALLLQKTTYGSAGTFPGSAYNAGATAGYKSSSFNLGASGAPAQITKANVLEYIADCGTVLDEQNVPESGRWMVIPAWFSNLLVKSDLKDASMTGTESTIPNGRLGRLYSFTLYKSNNLYSATDGSFTAYYVPFGTNHAITFVSQITKMEALRAESTFGDLIRGLNVFGFDVIKPEALGLLYCRK